MTWIWRSVIAYARARLLEASTWRNLILLVGGSWAAAHPDLVSAIVPVCVAVAGAIGTLLPDFLGAARRETDPDDPSDPGAVAPVAGPAAGAADRGAGRMRVALPADRIFSPEFDERNGDAGWNG